MANAPDFFVKKMFLEISGGKEDIDAKSIFNYINKNSF